MVIVDHQELQRSVCQKGRLPIMDLKQAYDVELMSSTYKIQHELWPLDEIDSRNAKFPCCRVWTPLPVVSWLAPFIGLLGICQEDGAILDFSGSNIVNVDEFSFGATARYVQLDREKVTSIPNTGQRSHGTMRYGRVYVILSTRATTSSHATHIHLLQIVSTDSATTDRWIGTC